MKTGKPIRIKLNDQLNVPLHRQLYRQLYNLANEHQQSNQR